MYNVSKVKTIKGLYFQDIVDAKETPLEETLGSKRYKLFTESFKMTMEEYLKDVNETPKHLDITVRNIRNDEHAKYDRFFEIATTLHVQVGDLFSQMDFTFEIFRPAKGTDEGDEEADLMSYYMAERKGDKSE